ncbi:hypothetical protein [uncultured Jatrophihabitans sp.]|uniref:hypothetical protein n=1 Tax=uncultured Jatrophihabitans sp. TaxID=1610747 RepID=UPI0035CB1480
MTALLLVDRSSGRTFAQFVLDSGTLDSADDEVVSVVGSFNDWVPGVHVLAPQEDGSLVVLVEVHHPGDVHFRYLASGGRWFDDQSAHVINDYGSTLHRDAAQETDVAGVVADVTAAADPVSPPALSKKAAARKATAKKAAAKKAVAKVPAKKAAAAKEAPAKKATAKKATAKKVAAKKAAAKKVAAKKAAAKKATAKKAARKSS